MSGALKTLNASDDDPNHQTPATTLSHLPDNVIEKILSFLPINLAAQANTVCRQWASLWPSFPVIDLDEKSYTDPDRFADMLHFSLRRCKNQGFLDKLRIRATVIHAFEEVSEWIDFAIDKSVKELEVHDLEHNRVNKTLEITSEDVLTLKSLTTLKLEHVRMYVSDGIVIDDVIVTDAVSLPSLKTLSLKGVRIYDDSEKANICPLLAGCPSLEHLSFHDCMLYDNIFEISSNSLKSLEFRQCDVTGLTITAKNLESFTFYSNYSDFDYDYPYLEVLSLWECDNLKHVDIYALGLRKLRLYRCLQVMENSFHTPSLKSFEFSGCLKAKVQFVEAPSGLRKTRIQIVGNSWPLEYYSTMRNFLESFDCSEEVKLYIQEAECLVIPEDCRMKWSPPLPNIKQLVLCFCTPMVNLEHFLKIPQSLTWMAPSAVSFLQIWVDKDDDNTDDDDTDDEDDEGDEDGEDEDGDL